MNDAIQVGQPVDIYWNLHKSVFSVRARSGPNRGCVIAHTSEFALADAKFVVSQAGRRRVLLEKRKNVHALIRGKWAQTPESFDHDHAFYDPYTTETFLRKSDKSALGSASKVTGTVSDNRPKIQIPIATESTTNEH